MNPESKSEQTSTSTPPPVKDSQPVKNPLKPWLIASTIAAMIFACLAGLFLLAFVGQTKQQKMLMPVTITFRTAISDSQGLVAQLHNQSGELFKVLVEMRSPSTGTEKSGEIIMPAGGTTEIGWAEGWKFVPGDTLTIKHTKFSPLSVVTPKIK